MIVAFLVPLTALFCGALVGASLAVAARVAPVLDHGPIRFAAIALLTPLAILAATSAQAFFSYAGQCSGWMDSGSRPCTRSEFVFQDYELTAVFAVLLSLFAIPAAMAVFRAMRPRQ